MDKEESGCLEIPVRREAVNFAARDGKESVVHLKCRGAKERHSLDDGLNSLLIIIQEKEASFKERMNDGEVLQNRLKDIRQEKEATISKRKIIDDDLRALNNEKIGETFIKLRGSLQYRTEKALNEAISRLELQLTTHNYRVSEEKKIVQEIDRLKRSKKILKEYLSLEEQLNQMKTNQRMMRLQRDGLYRQVTLLKADEDEIKKSSLENRTQIEQLKIDLDELHAQKRKAMSELKQTSQPIPHLRELHQKRPHNLRRKESGSMSQQYCLKEFRATSQDFSHCRKERHEGKSINDLQAKEALCNTLMTYLHRLTASPTATISSAPVVEQDSKAGTSPAVKIQDGDMVLVLKRKNEVDDSFICQKSYRAPKKGKRDRKRTQQNRLLCHTPETINQFYKLDISPPCSLIDVPLCLEALTAKKHQFHHRSEYMASRLSHERLLTSIVECVSKIDINCKFQSNLSQQKSDCDNSATCIHNEVPVVSNEHLFSTQHVLERCLSPSLEIGFEDGSSTPEYGHTDCFALNGEINLQHMGKNHLANLEVFSGMSADFNEPASDCNESTSNGGVKFINMEENVCFSEQKSINFGDYGTISNDNLGLFQRDFIFANPNSSKKYDENIEPLDPLKGPVVLRTGTDFHMANGMCNGDEPNGSEIKVDENLNSDQGSENGIVYSI